jgi:hypothetical protein
MYYKIIKNKYWDLTYEFNLLCQEYFFDIILKLKQISHSFNYLTVYVLWYSSFYKLPDETKQILLL